MSYFQLWAVWSDGTVKNKNTIAGTFGSASIQRNTQVAKGRIPRSRFTGGCSREWLCGTVPHAVEDRQAMRFADLVENPASGAAAGDQPAPAQKIQILRNRPCRPATPSTISDTADSPRRSRNSMMRSRWTFPSSFSTSLICAT